MALQVVREKEEQTRDGQIIPYWVKDPDLDLGGSGELSFVDAIAAAVTAAETFTSLVATNWRAKRTSKASVRVAVEFTVAGIPPAPAGEETIQYTFNYRAESKLVYYPTEIIGVWDKVGELDLSAEDWGREAFVNVRRDDGQFRLIGLQVDPLPETERLVYTVPNALVDDTYRHLIRNLCGAFNSEAFWDAQQGERQLVSAGGGPRTIDDWQLYFGFGYRPTRFDVPIGNELSDDYFEIPELRGDWIYWTDDVMALRSDVMQLIPQFAIVQRVWDEYDLNDLTLPGLT